MLIFRSKSGIYLSNYGIKILTEQEKEEKIKANEIFNRNNLITKVLQKIILQRNIIKKNRFNIICDLKHYIWLQSPAFECPVCLDECGHIGKFQCCHAICFDCFGQLKKLICPLCRSN